MSSKVLWEVIVGNIGAVYRGHDRAEAVKTFREYVVLSGSRSGGRAWGESVDLLRDGEPVNQHTGHLSGGDRRRRSPKRNMASKSGSKAAAKRRVAQIRAAHDLGVGSIGLVPINDTGENTSGQSGSARRNSRGRFTRSR